MKPHDCGVECHMKVEQLGSETHVPRLEPPCPREASCALSPTAVWIPDVSRHAYTVWLGCSADEASCPKARSLDEDILSIDAVDAPSESLPVGNDAGLPSVLGGGPVSGQDVRC